MLFRKNIFYFFKKNNQSMSPNDYCIFIQARRHCAYFNYIFHCSNLFLAFNKLTCF